MVLPSITTYLQVTIFNISSGTWSYGTSIPYGYAADHIAIYRYKDKVGVIGGRGFFTDSFLRGPPEASASRAFHFNHNSDAHLWYTPATDSWEVRAPLPVPRAAVTAVAVDNRVGNRTSILVLAGERYNENSGDVAVVAEEYDPERDVWFCHRCDTSMRRSRKGTSSMIPITSKSIMNDHMH